MSIIDFFTISTIFMAIASVLGWWLKSRLDSSIRHEYDRMLELFKADQRRSEILYAERLEAFKFLSGKLLALRRYCNANSAEYSNRSEFEPRTDSLPSSENLSLLQHHEQICRAMDDRELFLSPAARQSFHNLFVQMGMGFNLEIWLLSGNDPDELNAAELYDLVSERVSGVMEALYNDLGFTKMVALNNSPQGRQP